MKKKETVKTQLDAAYRARLKERAQSGDLSPAEEVALWQAAGPVTRTKSSAELRKLLQPLAHRLLCIKAWDLRTMVEMRMNDSTLSVAYGKKLKRIIDALDAAFSGEEIGLAPDHD